MDHHQQTSQHHKSSLTSETSHWTSSSLDSMPLHSSSRLQNLHFKSNQIKSNHFYCHITTAQVPWWVKFLWACSRQCKKQQQQFTYGQTVQKNNNKQFTYGQTVQKKQQTIYIWTDSAKNNNKQFTYGQTVQKNNNNLHMDSTYLQTIQKTVCKIHVHIVYYKDILNYQRHIIHRMGTSTLCTLSIHNVVYT